LPKRGLAGEVPDCRTPGEQRAGGGDGGDAKRELDERHAAGFQVDAQRAEQIERAATSQQQRDAQRHHALVAGNDHGRSRGYSPARKHRASTYQLSSKLKKGDPRELTNAERHRGIAKCQRIAEVGRDKFQAQRRQHDIAEQQHGHERDGRDKKLRPNGRERLRIRKPKHCGDDRYQQRNRNCQSGKSAHGHSRLLGGPGTTAW
jgi:hypothetical protein